jgi:hypothetical protein
MSLLFPAADWAIAGNRAVMSACWLLSGLACASAVQQHDIDNEPRPCPDIGVELAAEKSLEAHRYAELAKTYEQILAEEAQAGEHARSLFGLAILHTIPGTELFNWSHASELMRQVMARYPGTLFARQSALLLGMRKALVDARQKQRKQERVISDLRAELDKLERLMRIDLERVHSSPR